MTLAPIPLPLAADDAAPSPAQLRAWALSLVGTLEDERLRMARGMHDELGQLLTALTLELAGLAQVATGTGSARRIASMKDLIDETIVAVRRISDDLRPLMLDDLGLNAAVESLARTAAERMDIEVTVRRDEHDPQVHPGVATALYRMVQEALTNVARHAHATDVNIDLRVADSHVVLVVEDNGIGLPADALRREGSWGLRGLRERVALFGGTLMLDNAPGSGARLTVRLPLDAAGASA
ncbi:MAG: sensor histidine kinase [Rubrivivax sp.]